MSYRSSIVAVLVACAFPVVATSTAGAQDHTSARLKLKATFVDPSLVPASKKSSAIAPAAATPPAEVKSTSSRVMVPFYIATAALQALDVHSSFSALDAGAAEANPLLFGLVPNRPAFVAVKAAMTVGMIYGASQLAKRHRVYAIIALVGINSAYALLVAHNYHVAAIMRGRQP
jgi:Domain of unknown function (DUF5658)